MACNCDKNYNWQTLCSCRIADYLACEHCTSGEPDNPPTGLHHPSCSFGGKKYLVGIEGGGTTWVGVICDSSPSNIVQKIVVDTDPNPLVTLTTLRKWIIANTANIDSIISIGVASFGPIDGKPTSKTYGYITSTPKPGWYMTDVIGLLGLRDEYKSIPFLFDTDVNAPAMGEYSLLKTEKIYENLTSLAYITVGTGVGVGLVINGKTVHGLVHPEGGHLKVEKHKNEDTNFNGTCPFHGTCIEGLCSTGSLASRKNINPNDLPSLSDDDEVWDFCAFYLALLCSNLILITSVEKIVIGGGVLNRSSLYPKIRKYTLEILNKYIQHDSLTETEIDNYITPSIFGSNAGIMGACYLASLAK